MLLCVYWRPKAMPQHDSRVSELEAQVEQLQTELDDAREYAKAAHRRIETLETGLLELQVRELQTGSMLSTDGVKDYELSEDLGLDLDYVGDEHQYVRLQAPEEMGDEDAMGASLPDAAEMCKLEQLRQVWRRGLMDLEELGDKNTQRAIRLWDNFDTMAEKGGTGGQNWRVDSEKVRRLIDKHEDVATGSLYELAGRVMKEMPHLTDGVVRCNDDNDLYLVGDKERIQDALKPLYEATELDDGSNIVVRR